MVKQQQTPSAKQHACPHSGGSGSINFTGAASQPEKSNSAAHKARKFGASLRLLSRLSDRYVWV
jgi:hypothetical protein